MKNLILIRLSLVLMLGIGMTLKNTAEASPPRMGVSFQVFYNELSPYGDWVMDPTHGYVWIPNIGGEFHPYGTNGYWAMTNYGNTWVSNYAWGWAPFHYGRWFWNDYYGWAWVPGYEWGPAWVNWRTGGGYYGWAPLGPGIGINVSFGFHSHHWRFIPQRRFGHRHFYRYYVPSYNVVSIYNRTTIINNTYVYNNRTYVSGPSRREVQQVTRRNVPVYQVNDSGRPGRAVVNGRGLNVYRPEIDNSRSANAQARPSRAVNAEEYRSRPAVQSRAAANTRMRESNDARINQRAATPTQRSNTRGEAVNGQQRQAQTRTAAPQQRQAQTRQATPQQRQAETRTAPQQRQTQTRQAAPQQRQQQVRTAPQQRQTQTRQAAPQQRQQQVRTAPQQRQSSPRVTQQRSSNNTLKAAPAQRSRTTSSPAVKSSSSSSSRSSGTVRSSGGSSSRSTGTSSRGGRGNN
jgi:hypothetical protein